MFDTIKKTSSVNLHPTQQFQYTLIFVRNIRNRLDRKLGQETDRLVMSDSVTKSNLKTTDDFKHLTCQHKIISIKRHPLSFVSPTCIDISTHPFWRDYFFKVSEIHGKMIVLSIFLLNL